MSLIFYLPHTRNEVYRARTVHRSPEATSSELRHDRGDVSESVD